MPEPPAVRFLRTVTPDPGGPADAELLRRFAETRDPAAFELLVWRHAGMVQATARVILRDRHLAEDAAQAAFLLLARHAGRVRTNLAGWLYRTVRRAAVGMRRAAGVSRPTQPPASGEFPSVAGTGGLHPPLAFDELAILHDELARLPDRYRLPVLLCLVEGLTHPQAAVRLGWPVGTVAGRLSRAKGLLRDRLTRRGVSAGLGLLAADAVGGGWVLATAAAGVGFAAGGAAGVSASVLLLTKGLGRAMIWTKLRLAAGGLLAAGTLGGVWAAGQKPAPPPAPAPQATKPEPFRPPPAGAPEDPKRTADYPQRLRSLDALKRIALAVHDYLDQHGHWPRDIADKDGKPLLSWRVAVLRHLEERGRKLPDGSVLKDAPIWREFNMAEPWDGPTNKPLLSQMPAVYRLGFQPATATDTYYQGFAGQGAMFDPVRPLEIRDVTDGTSNTILVAEVGPAVPWTKPADVPFEAVQFDAGRPAAARAPWLRWPFANVVHVATADADTHRLRPDLPLVDWWVRASRNGGEVLSESWLTLAPPLPATDPKERAELDKAAARTAALLADIARLVKEQPSVDKVEWANEQLRTLQLNLEPPAKPPAK